MGNWKPCVIARADPAGAFFENRSSILWWENPFVLIILFMGAYAFIEWVVRGVPRGRR